MGTQYTLRIREPDVRVRLCPHLCAFMFPFPFNLPFLFPFSFHQNAATPAHICALYLPFYYPRSIPMKRALMRGSLTSPLASMTHAFHERKSTRV